MASMLSGTNSLRQLTLGEQFRFKGGNRWGTEPTVVGLPAVPQNHTYTGRWQNVGTGTPANPQGNFIGTSDELMLRSGGSTRAETFVWQRVADATLSLSTTSLNLGAAASNTTINVTSNTTWEVSGNQSWLTISDITPVNRTGIGSFRINASANTGAERVATVTVTGAGLTQTIIVTQAATLVLSPPVLSFAHTASGDFPIEVISNTTWDIPTSDQPWLIITHITPANRIGNGSFRVNFTQNTGSARTAIVRVTGGGIARTVTVNQAGATLAVSTTSLNLGAAASNATINVTSNTTWSVSGNQPWLTISDIAPANRTGNGSFRINATENTGAERTAAVTITSGEITRTITVTQASANLSIYPTSLCLGSTASSAIINVTSNTTWNVSHNRPWLTISDIAPANRTGNGSFRLNASANTGASRVATVTVTAAGLTRTITVTRCLNHDCVGKCSAATIWVPQTLVATEVKLTQDEDGDYIVILPINITNNPGLVTFELVTQFDPGILTPKSMKMDGSIWYGNESIITIFNPNFGVGNNRAFASGISTITSHGDGVITSLLFRVCSDAVSSGQLIETEIKVLISGLATVNEIGHLTPITDHAGDVFESVSISISPTSLMMGNVLGGGRVSAIDAAAVLFHTAGLQQLSPLQVFLSRIDDRPMLAQGPRAVVSTRAEDATKILAVAAGLRNIIPTTSFAAHSARPTANLSLGDLSGSVGEIVRIPIYISNNGGFSSFNFRVNYDHTKLAPIGVTRGNVWSDGLTINLDGANAGGRFINIVGASLNNRNSEGVVVYVAFEIISDVDLEDAVSLIVRELNYVTAQFTTIPVPTNAHDDTNTIVTFILDEDVHITNGDLVQIIPRGGAATAPNVSRDGWVLDSWSASFENLTENINVTAQWLRIGAVSTGGRGHVTSLDVTYLARHIVGHTDFEISDRRIANLRGEDRYPIFNDVTMLARWLAGYNLAHLISQM
jgi:hypothetical protein